MAARVEPRIILRDTGKVDLVFEIREGRVTEVESIAFTGNKAFSDRRLRQVLETKQAGLLRTFIRRDTYAAERLNLDRQLLTEFYRSRGYIDAEVRGVVSEFARDREAFFVTFTVIEGQKYTFDKVSVVSDYEGVDAAEYEREVRVRKGATYSPTLVDNTIARMEGLAQRNGVTFMRVEPVITRNPGAGTLDLAFVLSKGPRVFVERIDIEGNATTLDQVIRRQFRIVEGDPLNPREIRQAAERIRALGYFANAEVGAGQGSGEDQVVVDVNVEEQPTGSLSFGVSYGATSGVGLNLGFSETNFLGRGQTLNLNVSSGTDTADTSITFIEPALLNRDLKFRFSGSYTTSNADDEDYDTKIISVSPALDFPVSEKGRIEVRYTVAEKGMSNYTGRSTILRGETREGALLSSALGYSYTFDNRIGGLNPTSSFRLRFGQDYAGLGGDVEAVTSNLIATVEKKVFQDEVTLRAEFEAGAITTLNGSSSRVIDRFSGNGKIRGFEPNGFGPRDLSVRSRDALGGNYLAVARFEAEFPVGLPEEYGITGGVFADVGSIWGLDSAGGVDDDMHLRSSVGFSVFWDTPIGPLRFNFSKALEKQSYDRERTFDLTISTRF
jgi:outer membrane protein insertion porin family